MLIARKDKIKEPFKNPTGEMIYEMIGRPENLGGAKNHSFGHVVIPPNCSSLLHYHPKAEETYYVLKGKARMIIDGKDYKLGSEDAILICPKEKHQIFNTGNENLEFIVICAPAWTPDNSIYL
jgi:mannose-6-phosphate isomerase-like protein (cupin superfamily)